MKRLLNFKSLKSALGFLVIILAWIFFAPVQVGGQAFYIIINGNSMEPLFSKGDLVILRESKNYQVNDVVAYQTSAIGTVFHRIIGEKPTGFVMKGDHNDWVDGFEPTKNEIIGKFWIKLNNIGNVIEYLRSPLRIALIIGIFCLAIGLIMYLQDGKSKKKSRKLIEWAGNRLGSWRDGYWWVMYAIGIIGIILGVICFTKPLQTTFTNKLVFNHSGQFSYSGQADQTVYESQMITTGDPVYFAITCNVNFGFDYAFSPAATFAGGGTYQMIATLQGNNGWRRNFELTPETPFSGSNFHSKSTFNVCQLKDVILETEAKTEVERLQYTLILSPNVKVNGQFEGQNLTNEFNPKLTFNFDQQQLYIPPNSTLTEDPYNPAAGGFINQNSIGPNTIKIFSLELPVNAGRQIALVCIIFALLGIVLPLFVYNQSKKGNETVSAKMLIGQALLETSISPISENERIVELTRLEDLARLAENAGLPVFFNQKSYFVDYLVRQEGLVYRYRQLLQELPGVDNQYRTEIIKAIKLQEFELYYQPIKSLQDGKVTQFEALVRWRHPEKGFLAAKEFLPQAEANDVVNLIDSWVLETACSQLKKWAELGYPDLTLSINIFAQQLKDSLLAKTIHEALIENQVDPKRLSIEISMDQLVFDANVLNNLKNIKAIGVMITVKSADYKSIDKLYKIGEIDQVKLGPKMVESVATDERTSKAAREIIEEAHRNNLDVTATGVETQEQMGFFQLNSCDNVQGYLVSYPLSSDEVKDFLKKQI